MPMVETILVEIAKNLSTELGSYVYKELAFAWGLNTHLKKLQDTVTSISVLLEDVELAQPNNTSHSEQEWFDKLRFAVYEADDLFDEIKTIAERKRLMERTAFRNKVRLFFSSSNQLVSFFKVAQRVKAIRRDLDDISSNRREFGSAMRPVVRVVNKGRENDLIVGGVSLETYSYVDDKEVVGRDAEKKEIINKLLDSSVEEVVSVIPIVGVGGLGKTALAQFVFNDKNLREKFDKMLWVSVPHEIRLKEVIRDIIASATGSEKPCNFNLEQLTDHLSRHIAGKKYMLVLDDVWDEDPTKWDRLKPLLARGVAHGSKILVTTRSCMVGKIMGTVSPFVLQPLNRHMSRTLFEKIAFHKEGHELGVRELVKEVLELCRNVPLVIRVIAAVLANKFTVQDWSLFIANELSNVDSYDNNVMAILKLSYDHLCPKQKPCFSYCSLFPRGYEFDKSKLVSLWIAQGFIDRLHSKSLLSWEDVGKQYLDNLLNKSLFQGDESQDTCKLHDLMYDLCCSVAGGRSQMVSSAENDFGMGTRHISIGYQVDSSWEIPTSLQSLKQLRTILFAERPCYGTKMSMLVCEDLISSFHCLRVLDLHNMGIEELSKAIGKLIHLRYLDLSHNESLKKLPNSMTLLLNLQYLDLRECWTLEMIPRDLKKLVNLRHFWLPYSAITSPEIHFPSGLRNLTNLQTLNVFYVRTKYDTYSSCGGQNKSTWGCLSDLRPLNNLKGVLSIFITSSYSNMALDAGEANLKAKKNLKSLALHFSDDIGAEENEMVLENLQPHDKLVNLRIENYQGVKLPTWMAEDQLASSLSHLASIFIWECPNIRQLPSFAHLPHLKSLSLRTLQGVEYIESVDYEASSSASLLSSSRFFPSLTKLHIADLPQLKGWSRSPTAIENLSFPHVSEVLISHCPDLESMPSCPNVESLILGRHPTQSLEILKLPTANNSSWVPKLKCLEVWDLQMLAVLPREFVQQVCQLQGAFFDNNSSEEYLKAFKGFASIQSLVFSHCDGLMPLSSIAHQLGTLERMELFDCSFNYETYSYDSWELLKSLHSVIFNNDDLYSEETGDVACLNIEGLLKGLQHVTTLQSLELRKCRGLEVIPDEIGNLGSLSRLEIFDCPELASFPVDMGRLTNLKLLVVDNCPILAPKCQREIGEEWPKIQHIREVIVRI